MGKYEDLLEKAEQGDAAAFKSLREEFGGSALRAKAEEADGLRKQLEDNEDLIREAKFNRLVKEANLDTPLSLEDLGNTPAADITVDLLREKAEAKSATIQSAKTTMATEAGFDSVEEYEQALESLKQKRTTDMANAEKIGGATASSSGGTPSPTEEVTPYEGAVRDFKEAKKQGATDDIALGEAAHTLMASQAPVPIKDA